MGLPLDQIKFANAVRVGRSEETLFSSPATFRNHGTQIEMVAVKMPIENSFGETVTQPLIKLTDRMTGAVCYTSLMNAIYFQADFETAPFKTETTKRKTAKI